MLLNSLTVVFALAKKVHAKNIASELGYGYFGVVKIIS